MLKKGKKMVAPIVITILLGAYYIAYFFLILRLVGQLAAILLGVIPLALAGGMVYVCIQRIREIRSGEEDDLSQY